MKIVLKNLMEDVVIRYTNSIIDDLGVCTCDKCRLDIASYTLNRIPAKYTATSQGELLAKSEVLGNQFEANIVTLIVRASEIVKKYPKHK